RRTPVRARCPECRGRAGRPAVPLRSRVTELSSVVPRSDTSPKRKRGKDFFSLALRAGVVLPRPADLPRHGLGRPRSRGYNSERNLTEHPGSPPPGAVRMGRVLLVDDDPVMILDQLTHALGPQGMRIDVAHTAEEGLRQVAAHLPDVILLDVHLP